MIDPTPVTDINDLLLRFRNHDRYEIGAIVPSAKRMDSLPLEAAKQAIESLIEKEKRFAYDAGYADKAIKADKELSRLVIEARKQAENEAVKNQIQFLAAVFEQLGITELTLSTLSKVSASTRIEVWDDMDGTHYKLHKEKPNVE